MTNGDHEAAPPTDIGDADSPGFPDRRFIDLDRDPTPGEPDHALPEGAERHPLVDLSRDPTPGVADHALPEEG